MKCTENVNAVALLMDALDRLEAQAIHVLRETAAQARNPVLLFSGGKDSLCLLHLTVKAFRPDPFPWPVLHIDTGHNFPETLTFRDEAMRRLGERLIVRRVEDTIKAGRAQDENGAYPSRNRQQARTLMDALSEFDFDFAIGGARRDEEKARAKERFFSLRSDQGAWDPTQQRPELWDLYNGKLPACGQIRVFPLNDWTEKDVWRYLRREGVAVPSLYFSHSRKCVRRADGTWLPHSTFIHPPPQDVIEERVVRFRTVGDMTCTSPVFSDAHDIDAVIAEIESSHVSERAGRADDRRSENAMEDRKREGYF
jgi:sulfate adenylyltransferase subunit 2